MLTRFWRRDEEVAVGPDGPDILHDASTSAYRHRIAAGKVGIAMALLLVR